MDGNFAGDHWALAIQEGKFYRSSFLYETRQVNLSSLNDVPGEIAGSYPVKELLDLMKHPQRYLVAKTEKKVYFTSNTWSRYTLTMPLPWGALSDEFDSGARRGHCRDPGGTSSRHHTSRSVSLPSISSKQHRAVTIANFSQLAAKIWIVHECSSLCSSDLMRLCDRGSAEEIATVILHALDCITIWL